MDTDEKGGMVYPAIAEQLVFKKGFGFTLRSIVKPAFSLQA